MTRSARPRPRAVAAEEHHLLRDHAFLDPSPKVTYRTITREDEQAQIRRAQRGHAPSMRALLALHAGFVVQTTCRVSRRTTHRADLYQAGRMAFVRAVEMYDPAKGARLTSYASAKIRNEVARTRNDELSGDIYVPLHIREAMRKLRLLGPETPEGQAYGNEVPHAREVLDLAYDAESLDAPAEDGSFPLAETMAADIRSPEELASESLRAPWLRTIFTTLLNRMRPRHRRIITMRYLDEMSCAEVAKMHGCTTANIYQHERAALAWMRAQIERMRGVSPDDLPEVPRRAQRKAAEQARTHAPQAMTKE